MTNITRAFQYNPRTFELDIRIMFNDKQLAFKHIIDKLQLEDIMPPKYPEQISPYDVYEIQRRTELRNRFVDMISNNIAWEFIKALTGEDNLVDRKL
jgi:hypothetical protein